MTPVDTSISQMDTQMQMGASGTDSLSISDRVGHNMITESTVLSPRVNLTHDQANGNLQRYLEDLLTRKLAFQIPEAEVCDIRDAVEEIVGTILAAVERRDNRFKVSEILNVGSFYDGTKICYPDEFDFLVVMDWKCLAEGRDIELRREEADRVTVVCEAEYVHLMYPIVTDVVNKLKINNLDKVERTHGKLQIANEMVDSNGPATTLHLHWNGSQQMQVSIDITPAIRVENAEYFVSALDFKYEKFYQTFVETGSFFLIRKKSAFVMTFTETEATIIKSQLSQKHRNVLKILKYIHPSCIPDTTKDGIVISSYILKLSVIQHHYTCDYDVSDSISHCLITVLQGLLQNLPPGRYTMDCITFKEVEQHRNSHFSRVFMCRSSAGSSRGVAGSDFAKELIDRNDEKLNDLLAIADNKLPYTFEGCIVSRAIFWYICHKADRIILPDANRIMALLSAL